MTTTTIPSTEQQTNSALLIGRQAVASADGTIGTVAPITAVNEPDGDGHGHRYMLDGRWRDAADVILLPSLGQPVSITNSMGGLLSGLYLSTRQQSDGSGYLVSVCDGGTVVRGRVDDAKSLAAATITTGEPVTGVHLEALTALASEVERFRSATEAHERFMSQLVADAHEWADDNDLCGVFDRFMTEHGLEGRERDYEVRVTGNFEVYLSRTATSLESACDAVDARDVIDALEWENLTIEDTASA